MDFKLLLHHELEAFRKEIEATLKPVVRIRATPGKTELWESKFGGEPYIVNDSPIENFDEEKRPNDIPFPYPRNKKTGAELFLLAQFNFEEIPNIECFPEKGILQLFIDREDSESGLPSDGKDQTAFRVIFYPNVIKDKSLLFTDFWLLGKKDSTYASYCLKFEFDREPVSIEDARFENYSKELKNIIRKDPVFYYDLLRGKESGQVKIGGYHYSQNGFDPKHNYPQKGEKPSDEEYILLFQCESEIVYNWGDLGTACFFIKKEDLINLDFSKVIYHWDCT